MTDPRDAVVASLEAERYGRTARGRNSLAPTPPVASAFDPNAWQHLRDLYAAVTERQENIA